MPITVPEGLPAIEVLQKGRQIFVTGHSEYDRDTLDREYKRDRANGLDIRPPVNYYRENNPLLEPVMRWKGHAHLLFSTG